MLSVVRFAVRAKPLVGDGHDISGPVLWNCKNVSLYILSASMSEARLSGI